jgi:hypothetical protein
MSQRGRRPGDLAIAARLLPVCFLFFAIFTPGHFRGSDEIGLFQVTRSLFDAGTLAVPPIVHTDRGRDGRHYSHFSSGQPVLALPLFALGRLARAALPEAAQRALAGPEFRTGDLRYGGSVEIFFVSFYGPLAGALLVALFFLFERELGVSQRTALLVSLLFAATTYAATLSTFFLRHVSEAVTIVGALFFFHRFRERGGSRDLWLGSGLASATFLVRLQAAVAGPALGGYLAWCLFQRGGRRLDAALLARALPAVAIPLLLALAASATDDLLKWGKPWNVPVLLTASSRTTPLYVGIYGALLSPGMSVFVYSPLLLLAPWSFPRLWSRHRAEAVAFLALAASFLVAFSGFTGWTGLWSSPGPRYQFLATPLFLLPLGLWIESTRGRAKWLWIGALALAGLFVQVALMSVSWGDLIALMRWKEFSPKFSFLFLPEHSPVVGASRLLLEGRHIDLWIRWLWVGWPGQPPAPSAARAVLAAWAVLFALCALALARRLRRESPAPGLPDPGPVRR